MPDDEGSPAGLTISATELGSYAGFRFCPRCAWIRMHVRALPWQGFPGIFSSIDRYTKQVVTGHLQREGRLPSWMDEVGDTAEHIDPPHWSKFQATDGENGRNAQGRGRCHLPPVRRQLRHRGLQDLPL